MCVSPGVQILSLSTAARLATSHSIRLFKNGETDPFRILTVLECMSDAATLDEAAGSVKSGVTDYAWIIKDLSPGCCYDVRLGCVTAAAHEPIDFVNLAHPVETDGAGNICN